VPWHIKASWLIFTIKYILVMPLNLMCVITIKPWPMSFGMGPQWVEKYHDQCQQYPLPALKLATPVDITPKCRDCYDCCVLRVHETYMVHYMSCKKPWECQLPYPCIPRNLAHAYWLQELMNVTTCGRLFQEYFNYCKQVKEWLAKKQQQIQSPP